MTVLKLRILFDGVVVGPGKAELLDRIGTTGSIAAAGREMAMSYKRAWMLVEEMNAAFAVPLVASARGGQGEPVVEAVGSCGGHGRHPGNGSPTLSASRPEEQLRAAARRLTEVWRP